jgi:glucose-1-phosphate cytidylyltransferase
MRVVILAGGMGSRLAELTEIVPKPMVQIGGRPILWHIMKHYAQFGHKEFVIALGYKGDVIKEFFLKYKILNTSISIDLASGDISFHESHADEDWKVHLIETGLTTGTGARLSRLRPWLSDDCFMLTYGDGLANVALDQLSSAHKRFGRIATVTAVRPPARFGGLRFEGPAVTEFVEKPQIGEGWINGGYMVFEPSVFDYIGDRDESLERDVLEKLAVENQLSAYCHEGFWQCMDTIRDRQLLEDLWNRDEAKWRIWS